MREWGQIINGDCIEELSKFSENQFDSLVTDLPSGTSFMDAEWDDDKGGRDKWIEWMSECAKECLRVLKPGAHGLAWAMPRTSHWAATAFENAGFEIKDVVHFIHGKGFPKNFDVFKRTGEKQYEGIGTQLRPSVEHWILVKKPFHGTVIENLNQYGVGGLNIDVSRFPHDKNAINGQLPPFKGIEYNESIHKDMVDKVMKGRYPTNLIIEDDKVVEDEFNKFRNNDEDTESYLEITKSYLKKNSEHPTRYLKPNVENHNFIWDETRQDFYIEKCSYKDSGGNPSRFFYCVKIYSKDREEGLETFDLTPYLDSINDSNTRDDTDSKTFFKNNHTTVKNSALMEYLCRLVTRPGGTVLDPFCGSGSTGKGAIKQGLKFVGIEQVKYYAVISDVRCEHAHKQMTIENSQQSLF